MLEKIVNCYDSHTHFWATGQVAEGLRLNDLKTPEEIVNLKIEKQHYRAHWLVGFGWNQNQWPNSTFPDKKILDMVFPHTPVFFSRVDGHASWLNTCALNEFKKMGYDFSQNPTGGIIQRDESGEPTGILFDQAHINALIKLPDFTRAQNEVFFEKAQKIFNRAGFTHVRDLSMSLDSWQILRNFEDQKKLTVYLDSFITAESVNDLSRVLGDIEIIKKDSSELLNLCGVKIFIDGSLGSKTAWLSKNYLHSDNQGLAIWSEADIKEVLRRSWKIGLQVAIHCIGDAAVHTAVKAAREVSAEGVVGRLHLEHVQLLRSETIQMMKPLHVVCHMQPCHWLSDHSWLDQVLPAELRPALFQWELLRKNKIPFYFGSDSPIEVPSLFNNKLALLQSSERGVPRLNSDWKLHHSHPDSKSLGCFTEIADEQVLKVYFKNNPLF